jgi:hypothetical protein
MANDCRGLTTVEFAEVSNMEQSPIELMRTICGEVCYVAEDLSHMQRFFDERFHR